MKNVIYKITSPSGKSYIGQTVRYKQRINCYKNLRCKNQTAIYNAILKYGWENMTVEILWEKESKERLTEELNDLERKYIKEYQTLSPNGYNITEGGESGMPSTKENKNKIRLGILKKEIQQSFNKEYINSPLINIKTKEVYTNIFELIEKEIDKIKKNEFFYHLLNCEYPYRFINTELIYPFNPIPSIQLKDIYSKEDLEIINLHTKTKEELTEICKELKDIIKSLKEEIKHFYYKQ